MKKDQGQIDRMMGVLVAFMATGLLCLVLISYMELLERKIDINQASRRYILRMETAGYLTAADRESLERELGSLGVTGISFSGTTLSDAGYGNPVVLNFTGKLQYSGLEILSAVQARRKGEAVEVHEKRASTAKN